MQRRTLPFTLAALVTLAHTVTARAEEPLFGRQVVPLLYKLGCSAGTCHGAFAGKGNFRLSLFAADPEADYREIHALFGRRLNRQSPDDSLLLLKPTGRLAHGGDVRLRPGSDEYRLLRDWIAAGARYDAAVEGQVVSVRVEPASITCAGDAEPTALRVLARLENGREEDVTRFARLEPIDPSIVHVDRNGRVGGLRGGDTPILAHYAGKIGYAIALVPGAVSTDVRFPDEKLPDAIDRMVVAKLKRLNIVPSDLCDDAEFLRRAYLDVIGQLPTPADVRKFLADTSADKRHRLIDELLGHPLHAAVWATKLCDITGADNRVMYDKAVYSFHDWFRNKLEANRPWDQIVLGVLSATAADGAKGTPPTVADAPPWQTGYAARNTLDVFFDNNKFRVQAGPDKGKIDPQAIALHVSTAFLGVRLECAECHKHPHDRWTQEDFFGFTAAFSYIGRGADPLLKQQKVTVNGIFASDRPLRTFTSPTTGEDLGPRVLGGSTIAVQAGVDPRVEVWKWMVSPENPYFAQAIVNRTWAHYFGRGLIDPVDALSAANPPSHPDVMDDLVRDFVEQKYDLRHLNRRILQSRTYQRSWRTNATNARDERNFSHRLLRRLTAEQMLDAVAHVTGAPLQLAPVYGGDVKRKFERAVEMPLSRPGGADSYLLKIFDKPQRTQSCDCERGEAPNLSQTLYFYNDLALIQKIKDPKGRLATLIGATADDASLLEELYLLTLSRVPTEAERQRSLNYLKTAASREEGFEDVFWSLLNRQEFLVAH